MYQQSHTKVHFEPAENQRQQTNKNKRKKNLQRSQRSELKSYLKKTMIQIGYFFQQPHK